MLGLGRLEDGRLVHKQLIQSGYKSDVFVCNSLVDMYAKCGSMEEAWTVFEKMPSWNVVTWTTMILGHVQCRQGQKALELFEKMQQEGVQPDSGTFVGVMNACASILVLEEGRCVHQQIVEFGWDSEIWLHGWLCLALAEFMEMWRWQNLLPNGFLKWSLKMLLVTWCCQRSMLLLVTGISVRMLNGRGWQEAWRGSQVAPGLKWIMRCIHL